MKNKILLLLVLLLLNQTVYAKDSSNEVDLLRQQMALLTDRLDKLGRQSESDNVKQDVTKADEEKEKITNEKNDNNVEVGFGKKGLFVKSSDGNWATNIQWRAQVRYTNPLRSDPRQIDNFIDADQSNFELRRMRMKIGGHGHEPWLKYYFELDLQPSRSTTDSSSKSSTRLIDWRLTLDKNKALSLRAGQWKVNYNRERVDSSGRQTFVERSIVNRIFTVDRQVGVMAFGRLSPGTFADTSYYFGVFNGEGRSVNNDDNNMLYMGRLQWNFLGRDLKWRQSDVSFSVEAAGSLAFAAANTTGKCTRWSSSGCGNLDGFESVSSAQNGQYEIKQAMMETAYKWRGFAWQQELHTKTVTDRINGTESEFKGGYAQAGYFFHNIAPSIPENMEFALRYAYVDEPNRTNIAITNSRTELTSGINYFVSGHNNKLTLDFSHLTLNDRLLGQKESEKRIRFQWDVSF